MSTKIELCFKKIDDSELYLEILKAKEEILNSNDFKKILFQEINRNSLYFEDKGLKTEFSDKLFNWYNEDNNIPITFYYFKELNILAYNHFIVCNGFEYIYLQDQSDMFYDNDFFRNSMFKEEFKEYNDAEKYYKYLFEKFNIYSLKENSKKLLLEKQIVVLDTFICDRELWLSHKENILNNPQTLYDALKT